MATIAGSQFDASASAITVNVVETGNGTTDSSGNSLSTDTVAGDFNLEVYTGPAAGAPTSPFSGYQGLAILSPGGYSLELLGSGYAITDNGTGGATLSTGSTATGDTITGGSGFDNLILNGSGNTANGGAGGGYTEVDGTGDTVNGGTGPQAINVNASGNTVNVGSGSETITLASGSNGDTVTGGSGSDTITALGNSENITGGTGPELINGTGTGDTITAGSGNDTINVFNSNDTVIAGSGSDTIGLYGNADVVTGGTGPGTIITGGTGDTVNAGSGNLDIIKAAGTLQFNDNSSVLYSDTVVGFSQAAGDHIHLATGDTVANTALVNGGQDTLITLSDNSTILLKGVTSTTGIFN
jgi:hypothetical protein